MIPIQLDWQRPRDGVEIVENTNEKDIYPGIDNRIARARSQHMEPITYNIFNLENPIALHLINCRSDADFIAFLSRFGMLMNHLKSPDAPDYADMTELSGAKGDLEDILWLSSSHDTLDRIDHVNEILKYTRLHPTIRYLNAKAVPQLVLQPSSLADLLSMETAFAFEVGAVLSHCAHCSKAYLTGPMTGRRSHAVYCSDRCRVAAMRARNSAKSGIPVKF
jgi:hypothetical protein